MLAPSIYGPQGPQGVPGATGPAGPAGSAAYDWSNPQYEQAGDQLTVVDPALWADAATLGGVTPCTLSAVNGARNMLVDCSAGGAGSRVQGALIGVAAGDFCVALRVGLYRPGFAGSVVSTTIAAGAAYVDGADVSLSPWYGAAHYWGGGNDYIHNTYGLDNATVPPYWETWNAFTPSLQSSTQRTETTDYVFQRIGGTLTIYSGPARSRLVLQATHLGIGVGAGLVGVRSQMIVSFEPCNLVISAYRASLTEVP